ncbi:unnamed protein product [Prunus armeniaca]|uniref:Uncharacterized protein n=1 Tax=Prunus armeniaca TaxID=36596 RepID=A0A6J5VDE7_PRUAR|nr:unnamed protein product [Prunus armeniaca]CAB4317442.1 unnamed protein product [Prunus armeniaca]
MYASWTTEEFALGTINGDAMTDVMEDSVTDFVFGCTKKSTHLPIGMYNDLSYTPLVKGPGMPNFYGYRYVNLEEIVVGINRSTKIPHEDRNQDLMGMLGHRHRHAGFTYVDNSIFGQVADEFVNQMG